ncbi:hypothetical protein Lser_V15G43154 [Lactuca serriola]
MGKEGSEGGGGDGGGENLEKDKENGGKMKEECFVDVLIHSLRVCILFKRDRRFSRRKGSVVDPVIGVFLTQNISNHLSSKIPP